MDMALSFLVFVAGCCVGSFLNVCITRIPRNESVVFPASHCRRCRAPVPFYDNIPLLSFFLLRGQCRACGARIPVRYPLVELFTAILAVTLFVRYGFTWPFVVYSLFASALVVVSFVDLEERTVPDVVSLPGIAIGLTLSACAWMLSIDGFPGPLNSLLGIVLGGGMVLLVAGAYEWFTGREGMGGGDVKLLAMIGAFLGWSGVPFTLFVGSLLGSLWGIGVMVVRRVDAKHPLPFAPFLCAGALFYLVWGSDLTARYANLVGAR